ncbi:MAG TPA: type VI secretion system tube protein Hcp [Usitatibacter sp.]|nr:type VI secretion system tube protein Hcp [Usitatibacter sp.]
MNARKSRLLTTLAASLMLALPVTTIAAVDAFLKIDGIDGESTDPQHPGHIAIESWSFGATQTLSSSTTGRAGGKSCLTDLSLVKYVDKASPLLLSATMTGMHIPTAVISVRKAGEGQKDYLIYTLTDVLVSSVSQAAGGDVPMESVSFNFGSLKIKYEQQLSDGRAGPTVEKTVSGRC